MSKLDWSKAGQSPTDPGRIADVGDYGILSDRRAGRKGNVRSVRKKALPDNGAEPKSLPNGQLSTNSSKSRRTPKVKSKKSISGAGLTRSEKIARANRAIDEVSKEIAKTERLLITLYQRLKAAEVALHETKQLPRRSAVSQALHKTENGKP